MMPQRPLERLAPRTQDAYVAAVVGRAKVYWGAPDQRHPEQMRAALPPLLGERHLAWSPWNQGACGRRFFSIQTLGWEPRHRNLPPRTRRLPRPHGLRAEALQRLCSSATPPTHRALLRTTYAAGLRGSAVGPLQVTASEADRGLMRGHQGKGRKDRSPLRSARLLAALRADGTLERGTPWLFPGQDRPNPMPIDSAQRIASQATYAATLQHGTGRHTRRHSWATHVRAAGVAPRTLHRLLGHRARDTTTRALRVARTHLATLQRPLDL